MTPDPDRSPPTPAELADAAQAIARYNAAQRADLHDDALGHVEWTETSDGAAYDCGWHDGTDYGWRLAERELKCPRCGLTYADAAPT